MIKRGDIYYIRDTRQSIGSEQRADRPAVIISNNENNRHSAVYEVVYMTTQPKTDQFFQLLPEALYFLCRLCICLYAYGNFQALIQRLYFFRCQRSDPFHERIQKYSCRN